MGFDPGFGRSPCLATLKSSDRMKECYKMCRFGVMVAEQRSSSSGQDNFTTVLKEFFFMK